jgi:hypothetical protein
MVDGAPADETKWGRIAAFFVVVVLIFATIAAWDSLPFVSKDPGSLTHGELIAQARKRGPQDCVKHASYIEASKALRRAAREVDRRAFRRASELLEFGIASLGSVNLGSDILDDSGQHESAAYGLALYGRFDGAARERRNILSDRLKAYAALNNLVGCPAV